MKENKKNVELERASRLRTCKLTSVSNEFSCRSVLVPCGNRFLVVHQLRSLWIKCRKLGRRQPGRFMLKDLRTTMGSSEISSPWLIFYLRLHSRSATARITALMCTMGINWHPLRYVKRFWFYLPPTPFINLLASRSFCSLWSSRQRRHHRSASMQRRAPCGPSCLPVQVHTKWSVDSPENDWLSFNTFKSESTQVTDGFFTFADCPN